MPEATRPVPSEIQTVVASWRRQATTLRVVHVMLLIAASTFSIVTAAALDDDMRRYSAVAAAVAVGILSALDLGVKANGFRNAWRHMNAALARYHSLDSYTVEQLIGAYEDAEALIGDLPSGPRPAVPQPTVEVEHGGATPPRALAPTGPVSVARYDERV